MREGVSRGRVAWGRERCRTTVVEIAHAGVVRAGSGRTSSRPRHGGRVPVPTTLPRMRSDHVSEGSGLCVPCVVGQAKLELKHLKRLGNFVTVAV